MTRAPIADSLGSHKSKAARQAICNTGERLCFCQ